LLKNQGFINDEIIRFIELLDKQGFTKTMKELGVWKTTGARGTNQVMCNPYIWVLILAHYTSNSFSFINFKSK
jgi:hypothetical protein